MSGLKQAVRNTAKIIMFKGVYPLCYKVSSLRPLRKNKVIFAEIRSGTLTDSFRYIYEEIKTRGLDPQVYYVHNNKGGIGYLLRYLKLTWLMGNVGCVLLNDTCNLFGAFQKRHKGHSNMAFLRSFQKVGRKYHRPLFRRVAGRIEKVPCPYKLYTLYRQQ
jgi:CDP-ribitol ribitolphosphotransferase